MIKRKASKERDLSSNNVRSKKSDQISTNLDKKTKSVKDKTIEHRC